MERHFNVTVYVTNKEGKFIEENEIPDIAALREVKEETGLDVKLQGERFPRESDCVRPYGIQLNVIKQGEHEHMDFIYWAKPIDEGKLILNEEETEGINWYSIDEILNPEFDSFEETQKWCKRFSDAMK